MTEPSVTLPAWWEEAQQLFTQQASGVQAIRYLGTDSTGAHLLGVTVYDDTDMTRWEVGSILADLRGKFGSGIELSSIDQATAKRTLPATCTVCEVSWTHCSRRFTHQQEARLAADRAW